MAAPQMGRKLLLFPNRTELAQGSTMLASIENFRCPGGSLALHKCPLSLPTGLKLPLLLEQDLIKEQPNFCYLLKTQIMVYQSANCKISLRSFCSLGGWHNQIDPTRGLWVHVHTYYGVAPPPFLTPHGAFLPMCRQGSFP